MARRALVKVLHWAAAVIGVALLALGLGITGLICFSGTWGFMHGFPLLFFSVPMLLVGIYISWRAIEANRSTTEAATKSVPGVSN